MSARGLRFAMVTTFYPPYHFGGDAMFVRRLSHALARHGHTVDVIHDVDAFRLLRSGVELEPLQEPERVHIHRLSHPLGALSCLLTQQTGRPIANGRRIRRILDGGRYDVIHFHNVSLVGGPGVLAFGNAIKLYTAHEHWLVCPTHALWRHKRELCTGRQCFRCMLHYRRPPQAWRWTGFLRKSIRHIDAFLSPSAFTSEKHTEFGFPRTMEVMPYFLPEDEFEDSTTPWRRGEEPPRPYFLFVGRLEREKGVQDVIPLFDEGSPAEFWIAGRGKFEPELRRLAAGNPRVRFLGLNTPSELRKLYAAAIALVVPSIFYETFGYVVLEAFREGTPVVARRRGPLVEHIERSDGGLLFDTADELREALSRLATEPELRARLGEAGYRAVRQIWSETAVLPQYYGLIKRVAEEKGLTRLAASLDLHAASSGPAGIVRQT